MNGDDCGCGWDVEHALVCTATPGVLHPTGNQVVLHAPEDGCTDGVMHRAESTGWHNHQGWRVAEWYERLLPAFEQLTLDAA